MSGVKKAEEGNASVSLNLGKEIDRSLAEIVSALLKPAAIEIGQLLGDSIGIVSDRIAKKRTMNAQIGLSEVRKKLESADVQMEDITPPKEEELHLLINGLSLTDETTVRELWAGLFANALNPNTKVTIERPFLSVLATLSSLDAKIIDFLAFVVRTDKELRQKAVTFRPKDWRAITSEEKTEGERVRKINEDLRTVAINSIKDKADEYAFDNLVREEWASNLFRQGLIESTDTVISSAGTLRFHDERELAKAFENLSKRLELMARQTKPPVILFSRSPLRVNAQFTEFGERLARACGLL